jgi:hypothetical protein
MLLFLCAQTTVLGTVYSIQLWSSRKFFAFSSPFLSSYLQTISKEGNLKNSIYYLTLINTLYLNPIYLNLTGG